MPTLAMDHRDLISLLQGLLQVCKEAPGAEVLFVLRFIIAELELQEAYGTEVTLRNCERIIAGVSASGRACHDSTTGRTDAVLPTE